jgi:hypothetical protein
MKLLVVNKDAVRSQAMIDCFSDCLHTLDLDAQIIAQAARIKAELISELEKPCIHSNTNKRNCNECWNEIKKRWLK